MRFLPKKFEKGAVNEMKNPSLKTMMNRIGTFLIDNHRNVKNAVLPTLVVTAVFFVNYFFFGMDNTIIGPCLVLSFLEYSGMSKSFCSMFKTLLVYEITAVAAWAAGFGPAACVVVNAAFFFWNIYFRADDNHPDNYYTPGMLFILFQLFPVSEFGDVLIRVEALGASFAVTGIFLVFLQSRPKRHTIKDNVADAFEISDQLLAACESGDETNVQVCREQLRQKNETISDELYLNNYAAFGSRSRGNWYCRFVALFDMFAGFSQELGRGDAEKDAEKLNQMTNLNQNFKTLFMKGNRCDTRENLKFHPLKRGLGSRDLRFALQQVIALTPCMLWAFYCPVGNGFWLPVSVYYMLVPFREKIGKRVGGRLAGTLAGLVLCAVLYTIFPSLSAHIVILVVLNFLINSASGYEVQVAYLTCAILALGITTENLAATLFERLIYTLIGAGITLFVSRFVFPTDIHSEMAYLKTQLSGLEEQMLLVDEKGKNHTAVGQDEKDRLLVQSYVLCRRLRLYNESLSEEERDPNLYEKLDDHMVRMSYFLAHHFVGVPVKEVQDRSVNMPEAQHRGCGYAGC